MLRCEGVLLQARFDSFKGKDGDEVLSGVVYLGDEGFVETVKAYGENVAKLREVVESHKQGDVISLPVFKSKNGALLFKA